MVLNRILAGQLSAAEAAALLQLSKRQVQRILAAYRKEGVAALVHGNRGRHAPTDCDLGADHVCRGYSAAPARFVRGTRAFPSGSTARQAVISNAINYHFSHHR